MAFAYARDWIDAPVTAVAPVMQRAERLPEWFELVQTSNGGDLKQAGAVVDVTLRGHREAAARLTTVRVLRDVVWLDVTSEQGRLGRICLSVSPWDAGTAVELHAELPAGPVGAALMRWRLRDSIVRLAELVQHPVPQPVEGAASARGWTPGVVPHAHVRPAGRP